MFWRRKARADAKSYLQTFLALVGRRVRDVGRNLQRGPWQALAAVNEHDCGADEILWIPVFSVGVRNGPTEARCANPVSLSRIASQTAESASPSICFPLQWVVGSGVVRPETNASHWVKKAGFGQTFVASAQKVLVHGGCMREFGAVAR